MSIALYRPHPGRLGLHVNGLRNPRRRLRAWPCTPSPYWFNRIKCLHQRVAGLLVPNCVRLPCPAQPRHGVLGRDHPSAPWFNPLRAVMNAETLRSASIVPRSVGSGSSASWLCCTRCVPTLPSAASWGHSARRKQPFEASPVIAGVRPLALVGMRLAPGARCPCAPAPRLPRTRPTWHHSPPLHGWRACRALLVQGNATGSPKFASP